MNRAPRVFDRTADEMREVFWGMRVKVLSAEAILFALMGRAKYERDGLDLKEGHQPFC